MGELPIGRGLLGELLKPDATTIRIKDIADDVRSAGFGINHPSMRGFLGVPIRTRGKLLGNLYLTDKSDGPEFTAEDQIIIETLASYAAVAIENARLYRQIQRLAVLEERERIGMDLHDGIIQSIYAVGLMLEHASYEAESNPSSIQMRLHQAIDGLNTAIKDIRSYIRDLRPTRFQGADLSVALFTLAQEFQANTLADVRLDFDDAVVPHLSEEAARIAFHIVQEALSNAARHAAATELTIQARLNHGHIVVQIRDNGLGFSATERTGQTGYGLSNMQVRAQSVGGVTSIESTPGHGTTVTLKLPVAG
ncbi:MAG: GAF domain-containing sensor histidine kinase [Anaerolineae bacterium]|nr:GAF domain-containing sensor histidine kinase [Anaerolineae bacterium]